MPYLRHQGTITAQSCIIIPVSFSSHNSKTLGVDYLKRKSTCRGVAGGMQIAPCYLTVKH